MAEIVWVLKGMAHYDGMYRGDGEWVQCLSAADLWVSENFARERAEIFSKGHQPCRSVKVRIEEVDE